MGTGFFITGTDTGVGKTWTTVALMQYFKEQGQTVIGMKPVASGCIEIHGCLKNEDALLLQENASFRLPYESVNPYAYKEAVSPHLAAVGNPVDPDNIERIFLQFKDKADVVLRPVRYRGFGQAVEFAGDYGGCHSAGLHQSRQVDLASHPGFRSRLRRLDCGVFG